MATEIERKFLVDSKRLPTLLIGKGLYQFYLTPLSTEQKACVRVRIISSAGQATAKLTIKGEGLVTRTEVEVDLPIEEAKQLIPLGTGEIVKTRYRISFGKHVWDVDHFLSINGKEVDRWLAEIELESTEEEFEKPSWIGFEVSDDPRYQNASMSIHGWPTGKMK